jgi:hypothetical protein
MQHESPPIWPEWAMWDELAAYPLPIPAQIIYAVDGGSQRFATPTSTANQTCPSVQKNPGCAMWPTPAARDWISETCSDEFRDKRNARTAGKPLSWVVKHGNGKNWPTPNASDNRDRGNLNSPSVQRRMEIGKQVSLSMSVSEESGLLNPTWVEWLMGFPLGWTDLKPLAMDKFHEWLQQHGDS